MKKCSAVLLVVMACALSSPSLDRARLADLNQKARQFAQQKDWQSMHDALVQIGQELPGPTPIYLLRMASVEALLGHKADALGWVSRYAAMGLAYDFASDDELKPLINEKGFQDIATTISQRTRPIMNAEVACTLPIPDLMPEDITFDSASGTFVTSSVQHHSLFRVRLPKEPGKECSVEEIALDASVKRWPTFAVKIDAKRKLLWVTASAVAGFSGVPQADNGKAALFAINSDSGKVLRRFDLVSDKPAVLGDMCVGQDGTVYVTDSLGGGVYRLKGDVATATLEKIADGLSSPQTPALAADGKRLFVADYSLGIAIIDLDNKAPANVTYLKHPDDVAVTGIDGMNMEGGSLLGIQNGTQPERIVRLHLNPAQTEITETEIVEQASPVVGEATHAVEANGTMFVSANVGWDKVGDNGQLRDGQQFTAPVLLRFPKK